MAMTFAERMALRKKEAEAGKVTTALTDQKAEVVEKVEVKETPKSSPFLDRLKKAAPLLDTPAELDKKLEEPAENKPTNKMESYTLTKIITLNNVAGQTAPTEGELLLAGDMPEDAIRIKQRISLLGQCEGHTLKSEMDELKKLIKAAPEACQFLLPEELGQMVRALRNMTDNKLAIDMGRAKPRASKKKAETPTLSAADLASALDDL